MLLLALSSLAIVGTVTGVVLDPLRFGSGMVQAYQNAQQNSAAGFDPALYESTLENAERAVFYLKDTNDEQVQIRLPDKANMPTQVVQDYETAMGTKFPETGKVLTGEDIKQANTEGLVEYYVRTIADAIVEYLGEPQFASDEQGVVARERYEQLVAFTEQA